jgi:hypothetical protein
MISNELEPPDDRLSCIEENLNRAARLTLQNTEVIANHKDVESDESGATKSYAIND